MQKTSTMDFQTAVRLCSSLLKACQSCAIVCRRAHEPFEILLDLTTCSLALQLYWTTCSSSNFVLFHAFSLLNMLLHLLVLTWLVPHFPPSPFLPGQVHSVFTTIDISVPSTEWGALRGGAMSYPYLNPLCVWRLVVIQQILLKKRCVHNRTS